MKQPKPVTLTALLLTSLILILRGNIQTVKATAYQGDLIINGNNITLIEGNFNINGSIIIEENATLTLKNAILNFTQTRGYQFNITLRNPENGNPKLLIENTTINANDYNMYIHIYSNSTAKMDRLTSPDVALNINEQLTPQ